MAGEMFTEREHPPSSSEGPSAATGVRDRRPLGLSRGRRTATHRHLQPPAQHRPPSETDIQPVRITDKTYEVDF